jgi:hypothetical protein
VTSAAPSPGRRTRGRSVPGNERGADPADGHGPGPAAKSCPSALCEEDALLLGVVGPDGTVAYVQPPTRISADFVAQAQARGHPERWFRFSTACREAACHQWTGTGCGVIDLVIGARPEDPPAAKPDPPAVKPGAPAAKPSAGLPACGIRRTCRWFAQRGAAACAVCPQIIADTGATGTWRSWQQAAATGPPDAA